MNYKLNKENLVEIFSIATYGSDWLEIKRPKALNYLVNDKSVTREEKWADILLGGGKLTAFVYDYEDPLRINFSLEEMEKGFKKFIKECPQDYADLVSGDSDYYTASNLMQCVLLGEVVFG